MLDILENLCSGRGSRDDLAKLEEIALSTKQGSLCGLGKTAPNPVLTTLKYFREEYEAHLEGRCAQHCPVKTIPATPYKKHEIYQENCIKCGTCRLVCPNDAVDLL